MTKLKREGYMKEKMEENRRSMIAHTLSVELLTKWKQLASIEEEN